MNNIYARFQIISKRNPGRVWDRPGLQDVAGKSQLVSSKSSVILNAVFIKKLTQGLRDDFLLWSAQFLTGLTEAVAQFLCKITFFRYD